jgi:origin recognition complex subunit 1
MVRINFKPYTQEQLVEIVQSRLQRASSSLPLELSTIQVLQQDAVKYACARISRVTGDARRVLDICRRTVEKMRPLKREAKIKDVEEVVTEAQNTPTARFVEGLGWHEKVMLAACLKEMHWKGVEEIAWKGVSGTMVPLCLLRILINIFAKLVDRHLGLIYQIVDDDSPQRKPKEQELLDVLDSLVSSSLLSVESGALAARKAAGDRKVVLLVEKDEVRRVLADVGPRWNAILGVQG